MRSKKTTYNQGAYMPKEEHPKTTEQLTKEGMLAKLKQAEEQGNDVFYQVLGDMAKAQGMSHLAASTGLDRTNLYRSLRHGAHPRHDTIKKVLQGLGISIRFE